MNQPSYQPFSWNRGHLQQTEVPESPMGGPLAHRLFVPENAGDAGLMPLVVALHGCKQNAADFAAGTRFDDAGAAHGAVVLYPEQSRAANGQSCWNWFLPQHQARETGEPAAILRLVDEVAQHYPIDRNRIFVAGISAGGSMAAILGEQAPDVFSRIGIMAGVALHASHDVPSAFAAMSGLSAAKARRRGAIHRLVTLSSAGLHPRRPSRDAVTPAPDQLSAYANTRIMMWTGTLDTTVSPENTTRLVDQYARLLQIDTASSETRSQENAVDISRWHDAQGRVRIERRVVFGMGHAWSGGSSEGSYTYPGGPDASEAMMRFFLSA